MTTTHQDYYWHAGDDWQIIATLLDNSGEPFDLAGDPDIRWSLISEAGETVLTEDDVIIAVIDPDLGTCAIHIPSAKSTTLSEGRYTDMIRIVTGGMTSTLNYGGVWVTVDPWQAAV